MPPSTQLLLTSCSTSRVVTTNDLRDVCPNVVLIATSAASRPPGDQDTADPRNVLARVERIPAPADECLEPAAEIHRSRIRVHTDISQVAAAISRRDIHGTRKT